MTNDTLIYAYMFSISVAVTIVVYIFRGLAILSFMPGGILWLLILLSIATGVIYGVQKTKRY
ncbi:MAG: hypothetical protein RIE73_12805 [Coleofasciculus sp. C1-SOL-03]|uniref:hypothetical protein n=1 Tax=Coleofasciculus sp. C1-SOL-03 TaxID=3069522 RepID=UPI0033046161